MAGTYYPTTCNTAGDHNCDPCEAQEFGRIRSFGFIAKDYVFADDDPSNADNWTEGINNGSILIVPESNGEFPAPSPKMGPGYGQTVEQLLAYDFAAKVVDPNFASNCAFYNALKKNRNFKFFYRTSSQTYISTVSATIIPSYAIANDLTSTVVWTIDVKWQAGDFPCPFNTPETIFDECYDPNV